MMKGCLPVECGWGGCFIGRVRQLKRPCQSCVLVGFLCGCICRPEASNRGVVEARFFMTVDGV